MPQQNTLSCYTVLNCTISRKIFYQICTVTTLMPIWKINGGAMDILWNYIHNNEKNQLYFTDEY